MSKMIDIFSSTNSFEEFMWQLEFLENKTMKQKRNFYRLIDPNSKKKDRGNQREKWELFLLEKQKEERVILDAIHDLAQQDTPAGNALNKLLVFTNYLGGKF